MIETKEETGTKKAAPPIVLRGDRAALGLDPRGGRNGHEAVYTPEIAREICRRIAIGDSLRCICADPGMPATSTVREWAVFDREGFADLYAKAKERQMDAWVESIMDVAQDRTREPNDRRVEIDAIKWIASKLASRRYGDKLQVAGDPDNPLVVLHQHTQVERLSGPELVALEQFAVARLAATDVAVQDVEGETDESDVTS